MFKPRSSRMYASIAAVTAASLLLVSCSDNAGNSASEVPTGEKGGEETVLRVGALGKTADAQRDPHKLLPNDSDMLINSLIWDAMTVPGSDEVVESRLMDSWEQTGDTTWEFTVNDHARFHDGTDVTADDAEWSLHRLLEDEGNYYKLPVIPESIKAIDEDTVAMETEEPNSQLPMLARLMTFVMKKDTTPEDAMGTGPFKLESWNNGSATLVANENYHGHKPEIDKIEVIPFEDTTSMTNAIVSGQIDLAQSVGATAARTAEGNDDLQVLTRSNDSVLPVAMRTSDGPFADEKVREAIRLGVDRQAIVDGALSGFGKTANDILGTGDPNLNTSLQRERDIDKAKKLLEEADFDLDKTYELYVTPEAPGQLDAMKLFAEQMKDIGVKVNVVEKESGTFYDEIWTKADLYSTYWGTNDTTLFFAGKVLDGDAPSNETAFDDQEFNETYSKLLASNDEDEIVELNKKLQEIQYNRGGYVVWGSSDAVDIAAKNVSGVPDAPGYGRVKLETVTKS